MPSIARHTARKYAHMSDSVTMTVNKKELNICGSIGPNIARLIVPLTPTGEHSKAKI